MATRRARRKPPTSDEIAWLVREVCHAAAIVERGDTGVQHSTGRELAGQLLADLVQRLRESSRRDVIGREGRDHIRREDLPWEALYNGIEAALRGLEQVARECGDKPGPAQRSSLEREERTALGTINKLLAWEGGSLSAGAMQTLADKMTSRSAKMRSAYGSVATLRGLMKRAGGPAETARLLVARASGISSGHLGAARRYVRRQELGQVSLVASLVGGVDRADAAIYALHAFGIPREVIESKLAPAIEEWWRPAMATERASPEPSPSR